MRKIFLSAFFIAGYCILTSSGGRPSPPVWEQENVSFPMMNQEIRHSMQEDERQGEMRNKQTVNLGAEYANREQWSKFKTTIVKIQDRLRIVDLALQSIPLGQSVVYNVEEIKRTQEKIIAELKTAPYALVSALPQQISFLDDLQMTMRLLVGIVASYGAINQMERAERQILLDFAVGEVNSLRYSSSNILHTIRSVKEKWNQRKNALKGYVNADKQIIQDIMKNIKTF